MQVTDVVDMDAVKASVKMGYISERSHPEFPDLRILNYTDKTQWEQAWTPTTLTCRGLIYNADTMELVARGMPKWFNFGHEGFAPNLSPDDPVSAYVKWDGSLGILYQRPDGEWAIATRGSFTSEQALQATDFLRGAERRGFMLRTKPGFTSVVEIIYPENRIVVDYGEREELVPLGFVVNKTGAFVPDSDNQLEAYTLRDVLNLPFEGDEGFILQTANGDVLKYKHAEYLALHRVVSSLTEKEVWRQLRAGTFEEFAASLPDEFHQWAFETANDLGTTHTAVSENAHVTRERLNRENLETRKEQAMWIQKYVASDKRGLVFSLLDGRDIQDAVWKMVEPKGEK